MTRRSGFAYVVVTMSDDAKTREAGGLPPEGAFVLQFRSDSDVAAGSLSGRVEHVESGRSARFQSLPELMAFIAGTLAANIARG